MSGKVIKLRLKPAEEVLADISQDMKSIDRLVAVSLTTDGEYFIYATVMDVATLLGHLVILQNELMEMAKDGDL